MTNRKYFSEFAFVLASKGTLLIHSSDVVNVDSLSDEEKELADSCHIYLVVKRPRLGFVPHSFVNTDSRTTGRLFYCNGGNRLECDVAFHDEHGVKYKVSEYPHRHLIVTNKIGEDVSIPAHLLAQMCEDISLPVLRDLEVVYVGMAFGDGERTVFDRLKSHSTLQQVLADCNSESPDDEVLIVAVEYDDPFLIISMDGNNSRLSVENDRNLVDDMRRIRDEVGKKVEVGLSEAALIRYFQPRYNEKYKATFPEPSHSVLAKLFEIDIVGLTVEINTEDLRCRLYSAFRETGYHHICAFDLHDPGVRQSFFNMFNSGISAMTTSGPML